jgi:diaminohydroxyphosphoribosylaminopyrimidine deaminase/5-amino-6-(5-phosphoribosylamino)uracil reductase
VDDRLHMRAALALARRGLGAVWPNPSVGCVIVKDGAIVGRGWTGVGGRPHGESEALARAGEAARGAVAYVSLEPCCHWGKTPPCTDALIAAGLARIVISVKDPDPRVSGRGIEQLREAGLEVVTGVCAEEAKVLNAGFFMRIRQGRPLVTLKLATSLDGRIATHRGESQWITGETARERAHLLRAQHDGVMVGSNTVLVDNPELTCRLPGLDRRSPVRIVFDRRLRVPLTARVVADARRVPTWFVCAEDADAARREAFRACGVELIELARGADGEIAMEAALKALGARGLTRVLVEGGAQLAALLVRARLVDHVAWFRAPRLIGGDGLAAVLPFGAERLAETPVFVHEDVAMVGDDVLETLRVRS